MNDDRFEPGVHHNTPEELQRRLDGYYDTSFNGEYRTPYDGAWGRWTIPLVILSAIAALVILGCLAERFLP